MSLLHDVVKRFDTSEQQKQEITETLNLLVELAQSKAEHCKSEIEKNLSLGRILGKGEERESLYFPISRTKDSRVEYRCITQNTPLDLISDISKAVTSMIEVSTSKNIVTGIANIINASLKPLLGSSSGNEQFVSSTSTFIEGNGLSVSVMRFDCMIWGRSIQSESIKKQMSSTLACVAYKSVVDVSKISFDDFRAVYTPFIESTQTDPIQAIKYAKEIYQLLDGGSKIPENQSLLRRANRVLTIDDLINSYEVKKDDLII